MEESVEKHELLVASLPRLVAILRGVPATVGAEPVVESLSDGRYALTTTAVLALQGADGDPEMEWDDVVAQWLDHPDTESLLESYDPAELDSVLAELHRRAAELGEGERLVLGG